MSNAPGTEYLRSSSHASDPIICDITGIQDELSSESDRVKVMLFLHSADSFLVFFVIFLLDENFSIDENFKDKHYSRQLKIAQQRTRECITRSAIAIPQWHRLKKGLGTEINEYILELLLILPSSHQTLLKGDIHLMKPTPSQDRYEVIQIDSE